MLCPDCGHDNIEGDDHCAACGQPLIHFDISASELEQTITRETIKALSPHPQYAIAPDISVGEAIRSLVDKKIGCLLVEEAGELVGIFTERDVLNRISENPSVMEQPVRNFMTRSPTTIHMDDTIAYALHTMDLGGYRHLPVVNGNGKAEAIISIRDIFHYLCDRFAELTPQAS